MTLKTLQLNLLVAVMACAPLTANAVNSTQQPISTRFAQTQDAISIELGAWSFTEVVLDEADDFDGWSAAAEIVWPLPFSEFMQLRFTLPFYTDGEATATDSTLPDFGSEIDIDGNGGVYEFMTLQFEHQLFDYENDGFNGAYVIGYGTRTNALDTTVSSGDSYNHTGRVVVAGVKYDRPIYDGKAQWLVNVGARHYLQTDDLHPDGDDSFTYADLKTAVIFAPVCEHLVPVIELTYLGDFDYNALAIRPEVIIPFNEHVSFKLGGIIGLGGDGNQAGGAASLAIGF